MKILRLILVLNFLVGCTVEAPETEQEAPDLSQAAGRWDVTATQGEDSYPLWFELVSMDGALKGRFQPRGGHAQEMTALQSDGRTLSFEAAGFRLDGTRTADGWSGTGATGDSSFSWTAVNAPELPATDDPVWGEPISLFDGESLAGWRPLEPSMDNLWEARDGALVNTGKGANLLTEDSFSDFKLHIEVNCPPKSNSGIYLRGRYEVQVSDSFGEEPRSRGLGGIYGHITPTQNPAKQPGEWQVFNITLLGRWVTVELNGTVIIDNQEIPGITGGALDSREGEPGPLLLQGDHGEISYRNIVLTPRIQ